MATISVVKKHKFTHAQAKSVAEGVAKDLRRRFDLECSWEGDVCRFARSGLDGEMTVQRDRIAIDVKLGFLLSAVAPSIERAIHEQLDDLVATDAPAKPKAPAAKAKPGAKPAAKPGARKKS
jgi:putative polyhydroxyalkanoate system protein